MGICLGRIENREKGMPFWREISPVIWHLNKNRVHYTTCKWSQTLDKSKGPRTKPSMCRIALNDQYLHCISVKPEIIAQAVKGQDIEKALGRTNIWEWTNVSEIYIIQKRAGRFSLAFSYVTLCIYTATELTATRNETLYSWIQYQKQKSRTGVTDNDRIKIQHKPLWWLHE